MHNKENYQFSGTDSLVIDKIVSVMVKPELEKVAIKIIILTITRIMLRV